MVSELPLWMVYHVLDYHVFLLPCFLSHISLTRMGLLPTFTVSHVRSTHLPRLNAVSQNVTFKRLPNDSVTWHDLMDSKESLKDCMMLILCLKHHSYGSVDIFTHLVIAISISILRSCLSRKAIDNLCSEALDLCYKSSVFVMCKQICNMLALYQSCGCTTAQTAHTLLRWCLCSDLSLNPAHVISWFDLPLLFPVDFMQKSRKHKEDTEEHLLMTSCWVQGSPSNLNS